MIEPSYLVLLIYIYHAIGVPCRRSTRYRNQNGCSTLSTVLPLCTSNDILERHKKDLSFLLKIYYELRFFIAITTCVIFGQIYFDSIRLSRFFPVQFTCVRSKILIICYPLKYFLYFFYFIWFWTQTAFNTTQVHLKRFKHFMMS